jgi:hypothetical protein
LHIFQAKRQVLGVRICFQNALFFFILFLSTCTLEIGFCVLELTQRGDDIIQNSLLYVFLPIGTLETGFCVLELTQRGDDVSDIGVAGKNNNGGGNGSGGGSSGNCGGGGIGVGGGGIGFTPSFSFLRRGAAPDLTDVDRRAHNAPSIYAREVRIYCDLLYLCVIFFVFFCHSLSYLTDVDRRAHNALSINAREALFAVFLRVCL